MSQRQEAIRESERSGAYSLRSDEIWLKEQFRYAKDVQLINEEAFPPPIDSH